MVSVKQGKCYRIYHDRKGGFVVKVDKVAGLVASCTIIQGKAYYLSEPDRGPGERILLSIDGELMKWYPVET